MPNFCVNCGKRLSLSHKLLDGNILCNACRIELDNKRRAEIADRENKRRAEVAELERARKAVEYERNAQLARVERSIRETHTCTPQQLELLKTYDHSEVRELYGRLYVLFVKNREPDGQDLQTLSSLQQATGLTDAEIQFERNVKPYYYVNAIRREGTLPTTDLQIGRARAPILRRGEVVHYGYSANLIELKDTGLAISGGVQGVGFRVLEGVAYRVGAHRISDARVSQLTRTSNGTLILTNNRILLHPTPGNKPVNIAINKLITFNCYNNGLEIWREGRETALFFSIPSSGAVEIFALCLIFLLDAEARREYAETERSPFRSIPTEVKNRVLERDGGRCVFCGSNEGIHFDHIIPVVKGGDNTQDNIQILCKECNLRKHDKII